MALEVPEQKERKTSLGIIFVGIVISASVTLIGVPVALTTSHVVTSAKQCGQVAVKMFDDEKCAKICCWARI